VVHRPPNCCWKHLRCRLGDCYNWQPTPLSNPDQRSATLNSISCNFPQFFKIDHGCSLSRQSEVLHYTPSSFFFLVSWGGVRLGPLGTAATTGLLYQPQMIDDGGCRAIGGMKIGRGNRSARRKPAPVLLCPQQIPHDLTWARTRAAAMGSRRLTA
jgi:hypothetical protein